MEELPAELCLRIFSMLDYRNLACAALVCRSWSNHTGQAELWQRLYVQRWGKGLSKLGTFKSWKAAYEAQDRCERIGMGPSIIREGLDYLLVYQGQVLQYLGQQHIEAFQHDTDIEQGPISANDQQQTVSCCDTTTEPTPCLSSFGDKKSSKRGLADKILFFLGDLESAMRKSKRNRQL